MEDEEEGEVEAEVVGGDLVDPAGCQGHPGESACRCCLQTQEHELNIPQHVVYSLHTSALNVKEWLNFPLKVRFYSTNVSEK